MLLSVTAEKPPDVTRRVARNLRPRGTARSAASLWASVIKNHRQWRLSTRASEQQHFTSRRKRAVCGLVSGFSCFCHERAASLWEAFAL